MPWKRKTGRTLKGSRLLQLNDWSGRKKLVRVQLPLLETLWAATCKVVQPCLTSTTLCGPRLRYVPPRNVSWGHTPSERNAALIDVLLHECENKACSSAAILCWVTPRLPHATTVFLCFIIKFLLIFLLPHRPMHKHILSHIYPPQLASTTMQHPEAWIYILVVQYKT